MRKTAAFQVRLAAFTLLAYGLLPSSPVPGQENMLAEKQMRAREEEENLTRAYQQLRARFDETGKASLKTVERAWIAYKESDLAVFAPLARSVNDQELLLTYQADTSQRRTYELKSLVDDPAGSSDYGDPDTAAAADLMLNNIYRQCIEMLSTEKIAALKAVQSQWIEFRDLHCRFDTSVRHGRPNAVVLRNLTLDRVKQLRFYIAVLLAVKLPSPQDGQGPQDEADKPDKSDTGQLDLFRFAK